MTKWLITYAGNGKSRWRFLEFGGATGSESRGIVDILAIRKNHKNRHEGFERGDSFEIVLIQSKGGSAPLPVRKDIERLIRVAGHHNAKAVVLAEWKKAEKLKLHRLEGFDWIPIQPQEIFR